MAAEIRFRSMGCDAHVVVTGDRRLLDVARSRVDELDRRWSRFRPDSEITTLNVRRGIGHHVSDDTFRLVERGVRAWNETGGRFDPTVFGDLVREGYDRPFEAVAVDPRGGVSALHRNAGGIRLDREARTVAMPADAGFDPGGIGKGLAADIVCEELLVLGAAGVCVNLGGDLRTVGEGPADGGWVVSIGAGPDPCTIAISSGGVATSTTTLRSWVVGGERRNHLIDPRTGRSLRTRVVAVTALSRDAASAEVATKHALLAEPGREIDALEELGCDGMAFTDSGDVAETDGFDRFRVRAAVPS
ncbi:MAG: FAD:protein FMN transferase [Actinomycetota bacterium]